MQGEICLVYLYDIIVFSESVTQHFELLRTVIDWMPISQSILRSLDFAYNKSDFLDILSRSQCWSWQRWSNSIQSSTDKSQGSSEVLEACWMISKVWTRLLENCSALQWPRKKGKAFHLEWGKPACLWPTEVQLKFSTHLTIPSVHRNKGYRSWSCVDPEDNGIKVVHAYASQTLNHRAERKLLYSRKVWVSCNHLDCLEPKLFTVITDHSALKSRKNNMRTIKKSKSWSSLPKGTKKWKRILMSWKIKYITKNKCQKTSSTIGFTFLMVCFKRYSRAIMKIL